MNTTTATTERESIGSGIEYDDMVDRIRKRFAALGNVPLFTTNASELWNCYLGNFPEAERQWHNCNTCRHFIERYGHLVTIDDKGRTASAFWDVDDAIASYRIPVSSLQRWLKVANVTGVFLSSDDELGVPINLDAKRGIEWTHFSVYQKSESVYRIKALTAAQAMAEKAEDFKNVQRALNDFSPELLAQALALLQSDALYRSEKVLGPAKWLADLHVAIKQGNRTNLVWRAVATAPAGFCHPRSSMIGILLEDIASGMDFETVSRRFRDKMHPLQYQRPQAAPSSGTIAQAEKLVEKLEIARSLERRFARLEELETIWKPVEEAYQAKGGVFGHLKTKESVDLPLLKVPAQTMTWDKFSRAVLPNAKSIDIMVPPCAAPFCALLTAVHADAPPILQWDAVDCRNPVSWYLYNGGSFAHQWGLTATWAPLTGITFNPSMCHGRHDHEQPGVILIIKGAVDSNDDSGNALFPETLKSELHGVRSVIEAYSKTAKIAGREEASACGLLVVGNLGAHLRVKDQNGVSLEYRIDRWD